MNMFKNEPFTKLLVKQILEHFLTFLGSYFLCGPFLNNMALINCLYLVKIFMKNEFKNTFFTDA